VSEREREREREERERGGGRGKRGERTEHKYGLSAGPCFDFGSKPENSNPYGFELIDLKQGF